MNLGKVESAASRFVEGDRNDGSELVKLWFVTGRQPPRVEVGSRCLTDHPVKAFPRRTFSDASEKEAGQAQVSVSNAGHDAEVLHLETGVRGMNRLCDVESREDRRELSAGQEVLVGSYSGLVFGMSMIDDRRCNRVVSAAGQPSQR